ncbi:serine/threonine protein kinase [Thecamonas trahens ATCC 50062]|uniref:Serine/threonine protein kinase n=1 Tax=Thecamonas trahens ATCC 50062 TaxID=461836 RepID=A0A0L0D917_THETB|nr:serine/threonine protein kinase [Thecamonas trahens ATCC 50062]KNC47788.1 serine/threonine protein kinase [Thecamonas trahens ATCC 50062]|eukprot:XP_013759266.1 serine/threonine protein kinase [Thecamonas trahens ATCC 50062]
MPVCCQCGETKTRSQFSRSQLRKAEGRRCLLCVEESSTKPRKTTSLPKAIRMAPGDEVADGSGAEAAASTGLGSGSAEAATAARPRKGRKRRRRRGRRGGRRNRNRRRKEAILAAAQAELATPLSNQTEPLVESSLARATQLGDVTLVKMLEAVLSSLRSVQDSVPDIGAPPVLDTTEPIAVAIDVGEEVAVELSTGGRESGSGHTSDEVHTVLELLQTPTRGSIARPGKFNTTLPDSDSFASEEYDEDDGDVAGELSLGGSTTGPAAESKSPVSSAAALPSEDVDLFDRLESGVPDSAQLFSPAGSDSGDDLSASSTGCDEHSFDGEHGSDDEGDADSEFDAGSEDEYDAGSEASWEDTFPFEENIFALNHRFVFVENIATTKDIVVYRALDRETKKLVAIKIVDGLEGEKEPKEVRISAIVSGHPCVAHMIEWYPIPSTQCYAIVSDWVEGVEREEIKPRHACLYIRDTLAALVHVQDKGILYRDVKPSNMLLRRDGKGAIMIDFDCATFYDGGRNHLSQLGTEGYMAPEMMAIAELRNEGVPDEDIDGYGLEVDAYSVGILLGEVLFRKEDEGETSKEDFLRYISLLPHSQQQLPQYDLLLKLLENDPDKRIDPREALQHPFFKDLPPIGFGSLEFFDSSEGEESDDDSAGDDDSHDGVSGSGSGGDGDE